MRRKIVEQGAQRLFHEEMDCCRETASSIAGRVDHGMQVVAVGLPERDGIKKKSVTPPILLRLHYTQLFPDPRFFLFVLQNISGYKNAVECLLR